jgi:opacity protein-like surface antigen
MSAKGLVTAIVTVLISLAVSAGAQDERYEIGGILGRTFISDQGIKGATFFDPVIHSGKGLTVEGEFARRMIVTPIVAISIEGIVAYNPDEDLNGGEYGFAVVPTDYKQLFITPAVRANLFPTTAVSPWVSFGGGFGHFSQSKTLVYGGTNPGKSTTTGVIEAGAGLDVKVWKRLSVRGEVRDFYSGEPDFPLADTGKTRQHNFLVGGGLIWRF